MTSPQGRDRITAEDITPQMEATMARSFLQRTPSLGVVNLLNDPVIRRLVVRKCVEGVADEGYDVEVRAKWIGMVWIHGRVLVNTLCGPEETPHV
jgi:hypothetical protein